MDYIIKKIKLVTTNVELRTVTKEELGSAEEANCECRASRTKTSILLRILYNFHQKNTHIQLIPTKRNEIVNKHKLLGLDKNGTNG